MNAREMFKTNDMGCAAFLSLEGHSVQDLVWEGTTAYWLFLNVPALEDRIEEWTSDRAQVNPRQYTRAYGQIKKSFFRALDSLASSNRVEQTKDKDSRASA